MILTSLTQKEQITIPRSIMKKLDINAGSEVSMEALDGTVIIRKILAPPEVEVKRPGGEVFSYFACARRRSPSARLLAKYLWRDKF